MRITSFTTLIGPALTADNEDCLLKMLAPAVFFENLRSILDAKGVLSDY